MFNLGTESLEIYNRCSDLSYTRIDVQIQMVEDIYVFSIAGEYENSGEKKRSRILIEKFTENYLRGKSLGW